MKETKAVFHIGTELRLSIKPKWLDGFRKKYDKPYPYHLTFKTSTFYDHATLEQLKKELRKIAKQHSPIEVKFNKVSIRPTSVGWCIMIMAKPDKKLTALHKDITTSFAQYGKHIDPEHEKWEAKFEPHITIARNLTDKQIAVARKELRPDHLCTSTLKKITLTTIRRQTIQEQLDPKNKYDVKLAKNQKL